MPKEKKERKKERNTKTVLPAMRSDGCAKILRGIARFPKWPVPARYDEMDGAVLQEEL